MDGHRTVSLRSNCRNESDFQTSVESNHSLFRHGGLYITCQTKCACDFSYIGKFEHWAHLQRLIEESNYGGCPCPKVMTITSVLRP